MSQKLTDMLSNIHYTTSVKWLPYNCSQYWSSANITSTAVINYLVTVPHFKLTTIDSQAFPVAATKIWNALHDNVVSASSTDSFRHQLKTFLCPVNHSATSTLVHLLAAFISLHTIKSDWLTRDAQIRLSMLPEKQVVKIIRWKFQNDSTALK